jgi:hypothetical protein
MNLDKHQYKATCLERSLSKLQAADYEMVIEGCMLAGTHWFNMVLHERGVLPTEQDAMHAEFMSVADRRKVRLLAPAALDAIDTIEELRTSHVRGDMPQGEHAAERALECLRVLREAAKARSYTA